PHPDPLGELQRQTARHNAKRITEATYELLENGIVRQLKRQCIGIQKYRCSLLPVLKDMSYPRLLERLNTISIRHELEDLHCGGMVCRKAHLANAVLNLREEAIHR